MNRHRKTDAFGRPVPFPLHHRLAGPYTVYGVVEYLDEDGVLYSIECADEASYEGALNVGAEWASAQPNRPLDVRGERFNPPRPAGFAREAVSA